MMTRTITLTFISLLLSLSMPTLAQDAAPCSGSQYTTDTQYLRATASGLSGDATAAKKKALIGARKAINAAVKICVEKAAKTQSRFGEAEHATLLSLMETVMQQEAARLRTICEVSQPTGGRQETIVVVELPKAEVLTSLVAHIQEESTLASLFEEDKFRQAF